jgi:hypothetical protein
MHPAPYTLMTYVIVINISNIFNMQKPVTLHFVLNINNLMLMMCICMCGYGTSHALQVWDQST